LISLLNKLPVETIVIITCNKRITTFDLINQNYKDRFYEIILKRLNMEQWKKFANELRNAHLDIKTALESHEDLTQFVFTLCEGNPYAMAHLLATISSKIVLGENYDTIKSDYMICDIDKSSHDCILMKSFSSLSDNDKYLLIALTLFAVPATITEINKVSGLHGTDEKGDLIKDSFLANSIKNCYDQILIEYVRTKMAKRYSLPPLLRPILQGELKNNSQYSEIIENWICYYKEFAGQIGFCFDDFGRLEQLDYDPSAKQIENLKAVLDFCHKNKRWDDFYEISENTKYFFYTRGISGIGKDSIHYKRANVARVLGNGVNEFNSLLYHCNVSCKVKEWDDIEECFKRLDELKSSISGINSLDLMKYIYIRALYYYNKDDYLNAKVHFEKYELKMKDLLSKKTLNTIDTKQAQHDYIACLRWHSACLYHLAILNHSCSNSHADKIVKKLDDAIKKAEKINFKRAIVHSMILKAQVFLDIMRNKDSALLEFNSLEQYKSVIDNDVMYKVEYNQLKSCLINEGIES